PAAEVEAQPDGTFTWRGEPVRQEWGSMGKSKKNSIAPDEFCEEYSADTLRLYEMSTAPLDVSRPWETRHVVGMFRFLQRVWRNVLDEQTGKVIVNDDAPSEDLVRQLHRTIDFVRTELDHLRFNTAIAKLIELNNALTKVTRDTGAAPRA